MVFRTIVTGTYKPTYILGASHCMIICVSMVTWEIQDPKEWRESTSNHGALLPWLDVYWSWLDGKFPGCPAISMFLPRSDQPSYPPHKLPVIRSSGFPAVFGEIPGTSPTFPKAHALWPAFAPILAASWTAIWHECYDVLVFSDELLSR